MFLLITILLLMSPKLVFATPIITKVGDGTQIERKIPEVKENLSTAIFIKTINQDLAAHRAHAEQLIEQINVNQNELDKEANIILELQEQKDAAIAILPNP